MPIGPLAGERTTPAPKREQGIAGLEPNLVELGRGRGHFEVQVPIAAGVEQRKFKIAARLWREVERDSDAADYLWTREVEADDGPRSGQFDRNPFARFESETQIRRGVVCFAFDSFVDGRDRCGRLDGLGLIIESVTNLTFRRRSRAVQIEHHGLIVERDLRLRQYIASVEEQLVFENGNDPTFNRCVVGNRECFIQVNKLADFGTRQAIDGNFERQSS